MQPLQMSPQALRTLGIDEVAYIKSYIMNGRTVFVLHAADGAAVAVQESADAAAVSARAQELDIVRLH